MNVLKINLKLDDKTKKAIEANEDAKFEILTNIGIVGKKNAQEIIKDKDIYDTGELYRTMDYKINMDKSSVDIGSPKNYAVFVELGTRKMKSRPFLRPAILNNLIQYQQIAESALSNKLGKK